MQPCTHQLVVSTHASVRRRLLNSARWVCKPGVSTHASVRRRPDSPFNPTKPIVFQLTPP